MRRYIILYILICSIPPLPPQCTVLMGWCSLVSSVTTSPQLLTHQHWAVCSQVVRSQLSTMVCMRGSRSVSITTGCPDEEALVVPVLISLCCEKCGAHKVFLCMQFS